MKREFLEGKNLSFVLLLPSSITAKSVLAGGFALLLFPSNLPCVPIVEFPDPNVDLKGMVKKETVSHEQIRILCIFSHHSLLFSASSGEALNQRWCSGLQLWGEESSATSQKLLFISPPPISPSWQSLFAWTQRQEVSLPFWWFSPRRITCFSHQAYGSGGQRQNALECLLLTPFSLLFSFPFFPTKPNVMREVSVWGDGKARASPVRLYLGTIGNHPLIPTTPTSPD